MRNFLAIAFFSVTLSASCSTIMGGGEEDGVVESSNAKQPGYPGEGSSAKHGGEDLHNAKIWVRLDELEDQVRAQGAKIQLLERGLMLGIIPEELKHPADRLGRKDEKPPLMPPVEGVELEKKKPSEAAAPAATTSVDEKQYKKHLLKAQESFRSGRYGKAIAHFESLAEKFPSKVSDGSHLYWIGLSWFNLREYEAAKKSFVQLIEQNSASPWTARAKFNIARTNSALGLKRQALKGLRDIIKSYPYEDAAEMARMELERIEQTL